MYTMYVGVCIMYILCVYYVCIHVSLSDIIDGQSCPRGLVRIDTDCPNGNECPIGATCTNGFCCTGQYILELYGSLGEGS